MTTDRMDELDNDLLQYIVNVKLIQPVHYHRNNGSKTRIMTPNTTA